MKRRNPPRIALLPTATAAVALLMALTVGVLGVLGAPPCCVAQTVFGGDSCCCCKNLATTAPTPDDDLPPCCRHKSESSPPADAPTPSPAPMPCAENHSLPPAIVDSSAHANPATAAASFAVALVPALDLLAPSPALDAAEFGSRHTSDPPLKSPSGLGLSAPMLA